jgi:chromosome partitioning protein
MKIVSILNHKGGVGKSTIATNIAGYYANSGGKVLIGDFDMQQSSQNWLNMRPDNASRINPWEIKSGQLVTPKKDITHIIVDTPAGTRENSLRKFVLMSDKIIVPVKPSIFDILSTQSFLEELIEMVNEKEQPTDVCIVGSMTDTRTKSSEQLKKFIDGLGIECPMVIRQTQIYVHLAAHGLTIFDTTSNVFEKDVETWMPLIKWINKDSE